MTKTEFSSDQFAGVYPPGIERSWWQVARQQEILRAFSLQVPKTSRVLEIGCGTGIATAKLRAAGWDVVGVEVGTPGGSAADQEFLFLGTDAFDLSEELRHGFDTLVLFDVIEHLADAVGFLSRLAEFFPRAFRLVVTVPARQELWTNFDDHYGHFRRYNRSMLKKELDASGFRPHYLGYFFHSLYLAIGCNNLLRGRIRQLRVYPPTTTIEVVSNRLLGRIMALESRCLPRFILGASILAVAHRDRRPL